MTTSRYRRPWFPLPKCKPFPAIFLDKLFKEESAGTTGGGPAEIICWHGCGWFRSYEKEDDRVPPPRLGRFSPGGAAATSCEPSCGFVLCLQIRTTSTRSPKEPSQ